MFHHYKKNSQRELGILPPSKMSGHKCDNENIKKDDPMEVDDMVGHTLILILI